MTTQIDSLPAITIIIKNHTKDHEKGSWGEHLIRLCSSRRSDKPHSTNTTLDKTILAITLTTTTTTTISTTTTPIITQQLHLVQHQDRLCSTTRPSFFETDQQAMSGLGCTARNPKWQPWHVLWVEPNSGAPVKSLGQGSGRPISGFGFARWNQGVWSDQWTWALRDKQSKSRAF